MLHNGLTPENRYSGVNRTILGIPGWIGQCWVFRGESNNVGYSGVNRTMLHNGLTLENRYSGVNRTILGNSGVDRTMLGIPG